MKSFATPLVCAAHRSPIDGVQAVVTPHRLIGNRLSETPVEDRAIGMLACMLWNTRLSGARARFDESDRSRKWRLQRWLQLIDHGSAAALLANNQTKTPMVAKAPLDTVDLPRFSRATPNR